MNVLEIDLYNQHLALYISKSVWQSFQNLSINFICFKSTLHWLEQIESVSDKRVIKRLFGSGQMKQIDIDQIKLVLTIGDCLVHGNDHETFNKSDLRIWGFLILIQLATTFMLIYPRTIKCIHYTIQKQRRPKPYLQSITSHCCHSGLLKSLYTLCLSTQSMIRSEYTSR